MHCARRRATGREGPLHGALQTSSPWKIAAVSQDTLSRAGLRLDSVVTRMTLPANGPALGRSHGPALARFPAAVTGAEIPRRVDQRQCRAARPFPHVLQETDKIRPPFRAYDDAACTEARIGRRLPIGAAIVHCLPGAIARLVPPCRPVAMLGQPLRANLPVEAAAALRVAGADIAAMGDEPGAAIALECPIGMAARRAMGKRHGLQSAIAKPRHVYPDLPAHIAIFHGIQGEFKVAQSSAALTIRACVNSSSPAMP